MPKILITGGAGFIGSHLCEKMVEKEWEVIAIDNFDTFLYPEENKKRNIQGLLQKKNFRLIEGDIRKEEDLKQCFAYGPEVIVHLAARAGVRPSLRSAPSYCDINIEGTVRLLEACKKNEVDKFVFASSSSVYGNCPERPFREDIPITWAPASPYGASKMAGEIFCQNYHQLYDISCFCLRFFTVYGPRQRPEMAINKFARYIFQDKSIPVYGDGTSFRDYTYIDDIIQGIVLSIERVSGFEIFNLGRSIPIRLLSLIKELEKVIGKEVQLEHLPSQQGDVFATYADTSKAQKILEYEPQVTIQEGLKKFVDWLKKQPHIETS